MYIKCYNIINFLKLPSNEYSSSIPFQKWIYKLYILELLAACLWDKIIFAFPKYILYFYGYWLRLEFTDPRKKNATVHLIEVHTSSEDKQYVLLSKLPKILHYLFKFVLFTNVLLFTHFAKLHFFYFYK